MKRCVEVGILTIVGLLAAYSVCLAGIVFVELVCRSARVVLNGIF